MIVESNLSTGPLQDPVTWNGINYTGTQMTQWDFQNKGKSGWTGKSDRDRDRILLWFWFHYGLTLPVK